MFVEMVDVHKKKPHTKCDTFNYANQKEKKSRFESDKKRQRD